MCERNLDPFNDSINVANDFVNVPYVTRPIDKEYESLDVKIPVTIDGISVHIEHAPILFAIGVGGYMSASNYRQQGPGGFGGPGAP